MAGRPKTIPKYSHHKAAGQAAVYVDGHTFYLGKFGTTPSYEKYSRFITENYPKGPMSARPLTIPQKSRKT